MTDANSVRNVSRLKFSYRPHIDGLRAIAVLGVVLFHFGLEELPGGFIGVDIFFVISGFLISKSIYKEVESRRFSFYSFYERRARRILPAFIVVSLSTALAGYFILFPQELAELSKSLIAATLFSGNIHFYATSDYFSPGASQTPLLHLWSLGVEEQFYIVFPALVLAVHKWWPRAMASVIVGLIVASVVASQIMLSLSPSASFYLLPFRAFEILIGSWLALPRRTFPSGNLARVAAYGGLALICGGMLFITAKFPFPGLLALVPCVGTALVIWGCESTVGSVSRVMGSGPMKFFGKISYSLYLVHWPIAVFAIYIFRDINRWEYLIYGVASSTILAWLSYRYIEQPVRLRKDFWFPSRLIATSGCALAAFLVVFSGINAAQGFPGRVVGSVNDVLAYLKYGGSEEMFQKGTCFMNPEQTAKDYKADKCLPKGRPSVILWGNSHISQFHWGLRAPLAKRGYELGQITSSGCPPIIGLEVVARPNCGAFNDFAIAEIMKTKPDLLVIGGVWNSSPDDMAVFDKTLSRLHAQNIKVVVLGPPALFKRPVPIIIADRLTKGIDLASDDDLERSLIFSRDEALAKHFAGSSMATYVSILNTVCKDKQCPLSYFGIPLHFDIVHLTKEGSVYYGEALADKIFPTD
ncbi:acyltransferase family protein [Phyllobacterium endophyticum]|nr:acyltransferase family protein [Phyllobacterium endophyticum]MBB3234455.1 peptidoglycan/LPS O-acetylase OafA/YrhL [Phyllobacterium endophyticum]TYR44169.1 acyltransferase [Phyllobacterium endophyticum]